MFRPLSIALCLCAGLVTGCASNNPYEQRAPSSNRNAT